MNILSNYLNINIINIIKIYNDTSINAISKIKSKYIIKYTYKINNYTVLDLVIKSIKMGYSGFYINKKELPIISKYLYNHSNYEDIVYCHVSNYDNWYIRDIRSNLNLISIEELNVLSKIETKELIG